MKVAGESEHETIYTWCRKNNNVSRLYYGGRVFGDNCRSPDTRVIVILPLGNAYIYVLYTGVSSIVASNWVKVARKVSPQCVCARVSISTTDKRETIVGVFATENLSADHHVMIESLSEGRH